MEFRKLFRIIFVALVVAGLVLATGAMAAPPAANGDDNEVVFEDVLLSETRMPTKAQMRRAKPAPMPEASGGPVFAEEAAEPSEPLTVIAGAVPEGVRSAGSVDLLGEGEVEPTFLPKNQAYSYPPPYTRYRMANAWYTTYPHSTVGKLYFQIPKTSGWYVCSGAVAVGRAVWTAGHCVYTKGKGWHYNMTFYPAYRAGSAPYGAWTVTRKATLYGWTQGKLPYDIGMVVVADKNRLKISQVTGYLCFSYGGSSRRHWHDFGYPQASPFNGKYQYVCAASRAWQDARQGKPWTNGIGCDMTGGCSGGPWLYKYAPAASGYVNCVNSVNSYRYTSPSQPQAIHGPYFGSGAKNLYNWGKTK